MSVRTAIGLIGLMLLAACGAATSSVSSVKPSAASSAAASAVAAAEGTSELEGVWHTGVITPDDAIATLQAAGLGQYAQGFLSFWKPGDENVFTLRISGGRWAAYVSRDGGLAEEEDSGAYTIDGNTVTIRHDEGTDTHEWSVSGDTLTITYLSNTFTSPIPHGEETYQTVLYMTSPWTREKP